ncbi:hypothetical protein MKW92_024123 [Papaver armeniacum]|nr:hypothetical protein MKW92_024123 [Papaver armeniacum]
MLMQQNMNGNTPLHITARFGSKEIVSMFIDLARNCHSNDYHDQRKDEDHNGNDIDVDRGITSTESLPDAEKAATLNNVEQLVRIANKNNNTALHEALRYKAGSGIPLLLRRADPGFEYFANDYGETPLYLAVHSADFDLVEHIFNICPTQSYGAPGGRTAVHALALLNGNSGSASKLVHLLRHLLNEVDQNGRTALHYAAYSDYTGFVDGVMKVNPSLCYLPDKDGRTALHHAAAKGGRQRIKAMKIMLKHCMDCWEVLDNEGKNFLHVAAHNNRCSVLRYVLSDISSDWVVETIISTRDKNGKTPCEMTEEFSSILSSSTRVKRNNWNGDGFLLFDNAHNGQV